MQEVFSQKVNILPKMIPVTVQAGIETQPLTTEPASSSHRLHCLTANHHLLSTQQDGNRSPNRSLAREENIKRDAVDHRRNSLSRKGLCLSLDLGLSSFELSLDSGFQITQGIARQYTVPSIPRANTLPRVSDTLGTLIRSQPCRVSVSSR